MYKPTFEYIPSKSFLYHLCFRIFDVGNVAKVKLEIMKTRVYLIDLHRIVARKHDEISDDEFMSIAEVQGNVYSLHGFQKAYNTSQIDGVFMHSVIRFIKA